MVGRGAKPGATRRLADGRRITRVGLAALDVGFDIGRRHQLDLVAQRGQFPPPEMARAAGLQANQTGLEPLKKRHHLAPAQRPADNNLSPLINGVDLKNALGQINADSANLHSGWLLLLVVENDNHTLALRCREREPSTPSAFRAER